MPDVRIPAPAVRAEPQRYVLPAGTELWRVHAAHRPATEFKGVPADLHWGGGRFCHIRDGLSPDRLPFLYAGLTPLTAVCETLARDLRPRPDGRRRITQPRVRGRVLSKVVTAVDLPLVDLTDNAGLAAVHQDIWLVQAASPDYPRTRRWGSWILDQASWAEGLRWPSRQDSGLLSGEALALYERRQGRPLLKPSTDPAVALDSPAGRDYLNELLKPLRIRVEAPRKRSRVGAESA
ncbi:RES family NAD+ phosphorylase [Streptomyces kunmingensis]|uniref:RES family NAD+ phosphorylase n=1 Tax=Streptomyces kunmingensis TaxID=68225 RepID=A0ABU6CIM3_9ACTN|nr:RES family NAD+ phosphorylase [Streptomyces kunmingensis]MEB3964553.1 RES family NAD+ phosphorylase [Streptomyces kunmingensis]